MRIQKNQNFLVDIKNFHESYNQRQRQEGVELQKAILDQLSIIAKNMNRN